MMHARQSGRIAMRKVEAAMSAKDKYSRQLLLGEYRNLIHSVDRNRLAAEEIQLEKTEDEGDLATLHQNKELLYDLH
jgi:hypothetical protein